MNLLITGAWNNALSCMSSLKNWGGYAIRFMQHEDDEMPCEYSWVEGVICNGLFLRHPIEKFINLKYIQLTSAGYDRIPMEYIKEHKIEIHNARGVYSIPMAEFAIAGVLQLYKEMRFFSNNQRLHSWEKNRGLLELNGRTVCIVGCGDVGIECAKRFRAFGCRVIGVNRTVKESQEFEEIYPLNELDKILSEVDILILAISLTEQTEHLLNEDRLNQLQSTAVIVNISRGGVIDTTALLTVLPQIGGAVLDVFEKEPLNIDSKLWEMENVVITPHNSFVGDGNTTRLNDVILKNLIRKR